MSKRTDKIHALVDEFLAERRKTDGGWAEITPEDVRMLDRLVRLLVDAKCEKDTEGDWPIEWIIVNRRIERMPYFRPVPCSDSALEDKVSKILSNLYTAHAEIRYIEYEVKEAVKLVKFDASGRSALAGQEGEG